MSYNQMESTLINFFHLIQHVLAKILLLFGIVYEPSGINHHIICKNLDHYSNMAYEKLHQCADHASSFFPILHSLPPNVVAFGFALVPFTAIYGVWRVYKYISKLSSPNVPRDVILVYGTPTSKNIASPSPYVLKLETYLRMANLPYKINTQFIRSKEGKVPWILYNGLEIPDSQGCIEYLNKKHSFNFNRQLTERECAIALAFRELAENELTWCMAMFRYVHESFYDMVDHLHINTFQKYYILALYFIYLRRSFIKRFKRIGIGYKTFGQLVDLASKDLDALSCFLGSKSYFMGEQPSEVDPAIFGVLGQFLWTLPRNHPIRIKFESDWTNLAAYCIRMKKRFWPDWDNRLKTGLL